MNPDMNPDKASGSGQPNRGKNRNPNKLRGFWPQEKRGMVYGQVSGHFVRILVERLVQNTYPDKHR